MSRGKYCRRKSNAMSNYLVMHQGIDDRRRPNSRVNRHNGHYVAHARIDNTQKKNCGRFIYNHARKNVLEDCITDSKREALIRSGEYRIDPNPDSSYSTNEEVHQCGDATNIGHDAQLSDEQIKTICEQATGLCALAFIVLIRIILCLE